MTAHDPTGKHPRAMLTEPTPYGYIYIGMRIDPPRRVPVVRKSSKRRDAIRKWIEVARQLDTLAEVVAVTVYEAAVIPPLRNSPRFDVMVLVQTISPEAIATVESAEAYRLLEPDLVMTARNVRRIGDADDPGSGTFLFNHFTAADPRPALQTLEEVAGWFAEEAGASDATLLQSIGEAPYAFVNHVRLPSSPIRFLLRLAKPGFWRFVTRKLRANGIGFAPVICRPVRDP